MAHEFAVIKTARKADALLNGREADKKGDDVGEIENIQPGRSAKLTLTLPRGHCPDLQPGHYMPHGNPGMLADFTVTGSSRLSVNDLAEWRVS